MAFRKIITTIKNNKDKLLEFFGYDNINDFKNDGEFKTNTQAFSYAKREYNDAVRAFNFNERNSIIINPLTNRKIKKYSILNLDGSIRNKYGHRLIIENGLVIKNPIIIGIDTNNKEIAKFNINNSDVPFLQQTFGFNIPKDQIKQNNQVNNIKFTHEIPPDEEVMLTVRLSFEVNFSGDDWDERTMLRTRIFTGRELSSPAFAINLIMEDANYGTLSVNRIRNITVKIIATKNNATMELADMVLREAEPLNISTLYNEVINEKKIEHCIHDYMFKIYPKHSKSENQKNKIRQLNTTNDIYEWCKSYEIKMIAYDINRDVIKAYYPKKLKKLKNMTYLAFNNHLYPLTNPYIKKKKIDKFSVIVCDNAKSKLIEWIENGILPADIKMDREGNISSFIVPDASVKILEGAFAPPQPEGLTNNNTFLNYNAGKLKDITDEEKFICYTDNTEYNQCLDILDKFGIKDKMTVGTKISHLGSIIEKLYQQNNNANSFFPFGSEFNKGGYNYTNQDIELEENEVFQTIDKNKSYSFELSQLPYLITCDIKYHRHKKINEFMKKHIIIPHFLYIIDIDNPSLHLPNNDYYEGNTLIKAREMGINFRILEEQETETVYNYFKEMVNDLYEKLDNDTFKEIMNIHIGKFEMSSMKYDYLDFDKLLGGDELATFTGQVFGLNDNYSIGCKQNSSINIFNKKPISVQIKDRSRLRLFDMMKALKLKNSDIKQVHTDSITFKSVNDDYINYIHNSLSGWKTEYFKEITKPNIMKRAPLTFEYKSYAGNEYKQIEKSGTLALGNAGCGKTYTIINNIIPKLNDDYMVLSPSHATIKEYKQLELNCDVIQAYIYSNKIPEANNVIVDEIGMVNVAGWNMLVKCKIAGKNVMVYGDNTQLEPVNSVISDNQNFYNLMFDTHLPYNTKNYRNNFSVKYYDELRNTSKKACSNVEYYSKKRLNEVLKHNTEYDKAEVILAFTRKTRDKYNALMCKKLGINSITDIGAKIICTTNDMGKQYKIVDGEKIMSKIFNNFCFEVVDSDDTNITISNGIDEYTVERKKMKYFDFAYARTLHSVQGNTLKSFHYCIEDINWISGRQLYTLISRLKQ